MKKQIFISLMAIVLILALHVTADKSSLSDGDQSAYDAILKFTNLSDLKVQKIGELSTNSGDFQIFNSENSFYYMNTDLGIVEGAVFFESPDQSKNVFISQPDAETLAKRFVIDHYNNFTGKNFQLINSEMIDHGSGGNEYRFMWREFIETAGTPNFVQVSVNPESGKIISYISQQRDIEVSIRPRVSGEQAVNTAITLFPELKISRESIPVDLSIEYIKPETQVLTWIVTIERNVPQLENTDFTNYHFGGIITVDAQTGEVLFMDEWR